MELETEVTDRRPLATQVLGSVWPLLLVSSVLGCDGATDVRLPLIQTEEDAYALHPTDSRLETEIRYTFENRTGRPVYLVNCAGGFGIALDRLEDGQWIPAWGNVVPACLSPEILIEAGEVFSDTLHVSGGLPGSRNHPQFDRADPSGTYRIRWVQAYAAIEDRLGSGPILLEEYRVSNSFDLSAP